MTLPLFSISVLTRPDILPWLIGLPLVMAALLLFVYQLRLHNSLKAEVAELDKMKRHSIEYELVMKTMKLSVWRIDVPTMTITIENDYRDSSDNITPPPGAGMDVIYQQVLPEYADKVRQGIDDLAADRIDDFHEQYQMRIPHTGKNYWEESYATVDKRDLEGKPLSIVGTSVRIDKQKQIESALMEALYHAEESDRLKSAFLANISHEVRTPLNAIVGFSEVLTMAQDEEERQQLVKLIKQNNEHLLRLFNDMMRMSKLEARGSEGVKKERFALKQLFDEVADMYQANSQETGVQIVTAKGIDNTEITTDRSRLREILNQYVNNAMKFTASGSVTLGYTDMGQTARVWVMDTGIGIPAEKCNEHLFDRFVKVDEFISGTGLGLSICRSLAMNIGGTVGVESQEGKGSTFWVELPIES
ncbi:MAG: HAMP domain-containing histidine kinase [Prevotella sp.]|nr:HAMP domain-containing histidine kinase [Prevotella sp.]